MSREKEFARKLISDSTGFERDILRDHVKFSAEIIDRYVADANKTEVKSLVNEYFKTMTKHIEDRLYMRTEEIAKRYD